MSHAQRLLTGLQPTAAQLHIGNYFGSIKPFLEAYRDYESFLMVADYHALTTMRDPAALREAVKNITRTYLAAGVDPAHAIIFRQSDVPEHTELAWILECLVSVSFLQQAHAYKDKTARGAEANAGLFNYPILMAADILLYDTALVPVGEDQRQHIEYTREAAGKFNRTYGELFITPEPLILAATGVVPGTDGHKMSKSYKNTIPLFAEPDEITGAVMRIVTDSEGTHPTHVYNIHRLIQTEDTLAALYKEHAGNYKFLKERLAADLIQFLTPFRERYYAIPDEEVEQVLQDGGERARAIAATKMETIRRATGVR